MTILDGDAQAYRSLTDKDVMRTACINAFGKETSLKIPLDKFNLAKRCDAAEEGALKKCHKSVYRSVAGKIPLYWQSV